MSITPNYKTALALSKSNFWQELTPEQVARYQLNEPRLIVDEDSFAGAISKVVGEEVTMADLAYMPMFAMTLLKEKVGARLTIEEVVPLLLPKTRAIVAQIVEAHDPNDTSEGEDD